jgi:nucleoid-associated protein YgaU
MDKTDDQQELLAFQTSLKRRLRYLGSFFSIGLIIIGLYLLLTGMMALVTKQTVLTPEEKEASIFETPIVSPASGSDAGDVTLLENLPGIEGSLISGIHDEKVSAQSVDANTKSKENIARINRTGHWQATNYVKDDIGVGVYEVKKGDTLWEISEAVYGKGSDWQKILDKNPGKIGKLPNGQQALIIPGQILVII